MIVRVDTNVTTKETKHSISGSLPAAITSRCHHESMTLTLGGARTGQKSTGISPAARPTIGRMPSYEPVDLSGICNAGVEVFGDEPGDVPLGRADLRGLPFLIGPEPVSAERCFLLPGAPTSSGSTGWRDG